MTIIPIEIRCTPTKGTPIEVFAFKARLLVEFMWALTPITSITKEGDAYTGAITSVRNERSTMKVKTPLQFNAEPLDELLEEGEYKVVRLGTDDSGTLTMRLAPLEDWLGVTR